MSKLTNWMRESICKSALKHGFGEAAQAHVTARADLAMDVYRDIYNDATRRRMKALPPGWLPEERSISVRFGLDGRSYESLAFSGAIYGAIASVLPDAIEPVELRVTYLHRSGCAKVYEDGDPLSQRYRELRAAAEALTKQIEDARRQAEAAIASASTLGALVKLWPEIEPFTTAFEPRPAPVPALPTASLNAMLGLPVEVAA